MTPNANIQDGSGFDPPRPADRFSPLALEGGAVGAAVLAA
jgi:hypothetical protein